MIKLYTDGSYDPITNRCGYAFVIVGHDGNARRYAKGVIDDEELVKSRNVTGELFAVFKGIDYLVANGVHQVAIFYDYGGVEKWITGEWQTNTYLTKWYRNMIVSYAKTYDLEIEFVKVKAHSGDEWNEKADRLAKEAIGLL